MAPNLKWAINPENVLYFPRIFTFPLSKKIILLLLPLLKPSKFLFQFNSISAGILTSFFTNKMEKMSQELLCCPAQIHPPTCIWISTLCLLSFFFYYNGINNPCFYLRLTPSKCPFLRFQLCKYLHSFLQHYFFLLYWNIYTYINMP